VSVYVYDEAGRSPSPEAPPLPAEIRAPHARPMERAYKVDHGRGQELVQRVPNAGPHCAFLLARRAAPPLRLDVVRPWVPPVFVLTAAVFIGLIPVVRRIRRLSAAVRASAGTGYADVVAVEGDDEIGELSQAFRDAGREVRARIETQEAREQTLRDFLANTTHDVMTPLTALHGHLIAFREAAAEGKPPDERAINAAIDEAHYMTSLLHNLGVAARIEAGEPHLVRAPIDLGRLVERVASRHRIIANQHDVSLEHAVPERPLLVSGDETFLEQAVSNFVYNAIRYNRPGGHVAVIVETVEPTRFRLRVLDDGPGVPSSKVEQLAARNVRGESARTRHPDGQGLGLAIAAKVAAIHDFSLRFSNPDEGGLEVTLEGPLPAPELSR
jgi:signal transduction histidine kinase